MYPRTTLELVLLGKLLRPTSSDYGAETLALTKKTILKLQITQRKMPGVILRHDKK